MQNLRYNHKKNTFKVASSPVSVKENLITRVYSDLLEKCLKKCLYVTVTIDFTFNRNTLRIEHEEPNMTGVKFNQYLTFTVAGELYAINVANIREVLEFESVTVVPKMPEYMKGIINLRGSVVPVLDLKTKFGIGSTTKETDTAVIVTEMTLDNELVVIGLLCDSVSEVLDIDDEQIEPTPYMGTQVQSEFIQGMGKINDSFIIILDLTRVLTHHDLQSMVKKAD